MRERLHDPAQAVPEKRGGVEKETREFEPRSILSPLEGPNGERSEVAVAVAEDGELKHANFWDLDRTLLIAEPIHFAAVDEIFPEQAGDEASRKRFHEVYFAGFTLGNSYREWDRMWRIYRGGQTQYEDPFAYEHDFLGKDNPNARLVDEPGHPGGFHERADEILQRYGPIAYRIMKEAYDKDPAGFQKSFLKPEMMQLLQEKARLGQANVFMTANQRDFARGLVAFSGLYRYGLALATDETMAGGGKEVAIQKLIEELAAKGLKVDLRRATAIGDSIKGDVGSGARAGFGSGILVTDTSADVQAILERAAKDTADGAHLRSILKSTEVEAVPTEEVSKSRQGVYRFGKRSNKRRGGA